VVKATALRVAAPAALAPGVRYGGPTRRGTPEVKRASPQRKATQIDSERKVAIAVMWGSLVVLGIPGVVLTTLNDPENLPIALTVEIGGTVAATLSTLFVRYSAKRAPAGSDGTGK
jgi:hypothetical protein